MAKTEEIFHDAVALPPDVRIKLTERLIASLAEEISPEITNAQLAEVRRRIAQVGSGEVALIPGDEACASPKTSCRAPTIEVADGELWLSLRGSG